MFKKYSYYLHHGKATNHNNWNASWMKHRISLFTIWPQDPLPVASHRPWSFSISSWFRTQYILFQKCLYLLLLTYQLHVLCKTLQSSNLTPRCLAKGIEISILKRYLHTHVCCDICHNKPTYRNNLNVFDERKDP